MKLLPRENYLAAQIKLIRPGSRRCNVVTAGSTAALAYILILVWRWGKKKHDILPQPQEEMSEISQGFSFPSGTGSPGTKPSCCVQPLLGGSLAHMWARWGLRVLGETKARWSAAENQAHTAFSVIGQVYLPDLIRIFLFVYIFIWRRYGCTCYQYSKVKLLSSDYSDASMCVGIPEWQKVSEQYFFVTDSYLRQVRKTIFHPGKTREVWKSLGKPCYEEAEMSAGFTCTRPAPLGGLLGGKWGGGP